MTKGDGKPCKKCGTSEWDERGNCKQCTRNRATRWRLDNPEKRRENNRVWYRNNPEKTLANVLRWQESNPDKKRSIDRDWKKNNPEKVAAKRHRHQTRKTQAGGSYTAAEWKTLVKQYGGRCACCGKKTKLTFDHVIPVSKGGTSDISNGQPLCISCNSRKGDKTTDYRTKPGIKRWIQKRLIG